MVSALLLVEDDPAIARTVVYALQREGYEVEHVLLLSDARCALAQRRPAHAAVVLDIGLPDGSGLDWCRELRRDSRIPILMISARGEELDRVLGLEFGADDSLVKPFSPRELGARIRALLRRSAMHDPGPPALPALECDAALARVRLGPHWLALTRREFTLLQALLRPPLRVWSRQALLDAAWGHDAESNERTVDTHVKTLRGKLRGAQPQWNLIRTHRGLGYSIELPTLQVRGGGSDHWQAGRDTSPQKCINRQHWRGVQA